MILTGPAILPALTFATAKAARSLYLMTYTVSAPRPRARPEYQQFFAVLLGLAQRGLDCRLLSPGPATANSNPHQADTLRQLTAAGWKTRAASGVATMHAKLFLIDNRAAFVGSSNLSESGLSSNVEILTHTDSRDDAAALRALFLTHWNKAKPWL